ncbi:UTP--glucose-1-phosphate uridylyltransferase [Desulfofundulus australicus DSM 11792]|jgi:UTP--glucose-1-phosphate uridylyltransferase|uniref:UTP--glucose-1-phosphate uridylyltransferase n=1 Tax=Desulfofundulus australicus DSM 11792 TaxID=1121425 RepID=A0A1M4WPL2_9FIRM|nr:MULTISPECIES: UTP--glucose-1-phosphate uridylyltransferase GalU [Desulfofundulus]MBE3586883.1 UTP--glucose-1-phosphate uridylyltransferase GalU [Thermoanaerobacter sp.]MDK2888475.1 UTP--glucose-phosphate uridylyltransferase [Thermoanaerobacter sp.]SHE83179.1 UTP--glucose-1-phosphate uridylyltransferase [Desulfofundulus australicus DSM 11792]
MRISKAIIPAAGLGVRFLPATKAQPKEMLPIVDKPTIQYIIEEAVHSGIEDILIITGRHKRAIEDHFDKSPDLEEQLRARDKLGLLELVQDISEMVDIYYVRQKEPRGLGHAVYCARKFIGNEPFAVLLGDDIVRSRTPCLKQLLNLYEEMPGTILAVQEVPREDVSKYGILDAEPIRDGVYRVRDLVEKPSPEEAPSCLAIMGRYIIDPRIFDILAETPPGAGGEIQLTDALKVLCQEQPVYGLAFKGRRYDVGDKLGYLKAMVEFALDRPDLGEEFASYLKEVVRNL